MTTISDFCHLHKVTPDERIALAYRLAAMRSQQVLEHFGINLMPGLKKRHVRTRDSGAKVNE